MLPLSQEQEQEEDQEEQEEQEQGPTQKFIRRGCTGRLKFDT